MRTKLFFLLFPMGWIPIFGFLCASLNAQDSLRIKPVVPKDSLPKLRYTRPDTSKATKAFVAIRLGLWFGGDAGMDFSSTKTPVSGNSVEVSHKSGFGADVHFTGRLSEDFYWDLSLSGWYVSRDSTWTELVGNTNSTTWSLIIPFTLGASYYFPTEIFLKPYVQAGFGAVVGYSARTEDVRKENAFENLHFKDQKTQVVLGGYLGAGSKLALSPTFGFDLSLKYMLGKFSDPLYTGIKDFSGLQVTFGIAMIVPYTK